MISRQYQFLIFLMLSFFNPITLFTIGVSWTFIIVVPFTLLIWFAARWESIAEIGERSRLPEKLLGLGIYLVDITYNLYRRYVLQIPRTPSDPGFGLIDMLIALICVCVAFYGIKGFRHFKLPVAYLAVLIIGYQLETSITEIKFLQDSLANLIAFLLNMLGISTTVNGNLVTIVKIGQPLVIDASCTGVKGILAYGSLAVLMILDVKATNKSKALCAAIGFIGTFLVNILRLLSIFLVAYFFGVEAGLDVHIYLGYTLFIVWILLFWTISFKYLLEPIKEPSTNHEAEP